MCNWGNNSWWWSLRLYIIAALLIFGFARCGFGRSVALHIIKPVPAVIIRPSLPLCFADFSALRTARYRVFRCGNLLTAYHAIALRLDVRHIIGLVIIPAASAYVVSHSCLGAGLTVFLRSALNVILCSALSAMIYAPKRPRCAHALILLLLLSLGNNAAAIAIFSPEAADKFLPAYGTCAPTGMGLLCPDLFEAGVAKSPLATTLKSGAAPLTTALHIMLLPQGCRRASRGTLSAQ